MEKQVFCAKLKMFAAGLLQLLVEGNPRVKEKNRKFVHED